MVSSVCVWSLIFLLELVKLSICYPTRNKLVRQWVLGPAMAAGIAFLMMKGPTHLNGVFGYTFASHIIHWLGLMIQIVYTEPDFPDRWRRIKDEKRAGSQESECPSTFPFRRKVGWMLDLCWNMRRIGWNQEPTKALPPRQNHSRRSFILRKLFVVAISLVTVYIATDSQPRHSSVRTRVYEDSAVPDFKTIMGRVQDVITFGCEASSSIMLPISVLAIICVGLGISEPSDWPPMFGSILDAYSIRRFWGKTWHKMLYPLSTNVGKHTAHTVCKFEPGTFLSSWTQLFLAFFISGTVHAAGDYMQLGYFDFFSFRFFMLQACGILFEDLVIQLMKKITIPFSIDARVGKGVGYMWTLTWFCATVPMWTGHMVEIGLLSPTKGNVIGMVNELWERSYFMV